MADGGIVDTRTARISVEEALALHASGRPGKLETRVTKPITTPRRCKRSNIRRTPGQTFFERLGEVRT